MTLLRIVLRENEKQMLRELINFTKTLSDDFKGLNLSPKEGIHILLKVNEDGSILTGVDSIEYAYYSKKMNELTPLLEKCTQLQENAWCVNTNKCYDLPMKAMHICSPFSMAYKREHLVGGKKYEANIEKEKSQINERFDTYFSKAKELVEENNILSSIAENFSNFFEKGSWEVVLSDIENQRAAKYELNSKKEAQLKEVQKEAKDKSGEESIKQELRGLQQELIRFQPLADNDYILFYLDLPLSAYKEVHGKYLDDKLFNTSEFNTEPNDEGLIYGTNDFQNGFNSKMPFLLHQTASFDISGRISNIDARLLYEFSNILPRKTLPNPLPIFIYADENFNNDFFSLCTEDEGRLTYRNVIERLYKSYSHVFQNYYLLNWSNTKSGVVFNDFDFVAKFEYSLNDSSGLEVHNFFNLYEKAEKGKGSISKKYYPIKTIFELEDRVLKYLIQNKYHRVDYFSDFKKEDYDNRDLTFLSFCKYRKAVYDYVYKSNKNIIGGREFDEMIFNAIKDDFKNSNEYGIKEKLNYWYSLYEYFHKPNKNKQIMANKLEDYQEFVAKVAIGDVQLENASDEQFAFAAGQIIEYLIKKSETDNKNYQLLEPYLQKSKCSELKIAIANDVVRYKHAINLNETRFKNVFAAVETWETTRNIKDLLPELISGIFSKNQFFNLEYNKDNNENK